MDVNYRPLITTTRLNAFEMQLYRRMLRISCNSRKINEVVLSRLKTCANLMPLLEIRKTAYLGHFRDDLEYGQLMLILEGKIKGKRCIDRKKKSWLRNISFNEPGIEKWSPISTDGIWRRITLFFLLTRIRQKKGALYKSKTGCAVDRIHKTLSHGQKYFYFLN